GGGGRRPSRGEAVDVRPRQGARDDPEGVVLQPGQGGTAASMESENSPGAGDDGNSELVQIPRPALRIRIENENKNGVPSHSPRGGRGTGGVRRVVCGVLILVVDLKKRHC